MTRDDPRTLNPRKPPTRWQPQRRLDPDLAEAVRDAKAATGLSWREIGRLIGVSHSHLVLISNGKRVPSDAVVELLGEVLPLTEEELDGLREVAVVKRFY